VFTLIAANLTESTLQKGLC